ncbi:MAG: GNAT family N-acetyltransferase [Alphaproteobacteria bacterium]
MIDFRILTREAVGPLAALKVSVTQNKFCSSNLMTMAEASFEPGSTVYGMWDGDAAVGLLAIIDKAHPCAILGEYEEANSLYIWRLMVDKDKQGKGFGRAALDFSKSLALKKRRLYLSLLVLDEPGGARLMYEAFGFRPTGNIVNGEIQMLLSLG